MTENIIVGGLIVLLIAAALSAPYLPYPARYCAKHPNNGSCIAYAHGDSGPHGVP